MHFWFRRVLKQLSCPPGSRLKMHACDLKCTSAYILTQVFVFHKPKLQHGAYTTRTQLSRASRRDFWGYRPITSPIFKLPRTNCKVSEAEQRLLTGLEKFLEFLTDRQLMLLHRAERGMVWTDRRWLQLDSLHEKEGVKNPRNVVFEMKRNTLGTKHYQTR